MTMEGSEAEMTMVRLGRCMARRTPLKPRSKAKPISLRVKHRRTSTNIRLRNYHRSMGVRSSGKDRAARHMTVKEVTTNGVRVHPKGIVGVLTVVPILGVVKTVVGVVQGSGVPLLIVLSSEVAVTIVVTDPTLQSIVVSVRVHLFEIFAIGRDIRPIDVSLILIALLTEVFNRQRKQ